MTALTLTLYSAAGALLIWGGVLLYRYLSLPGFAGRVYDSTREKGLLDPSIDREAYIQAYRRAEAPRAGLWLWATSAVSLFSLPLVINLVAELLDRIWDGLNIGLGPWAIGIIMKDFFLFVVTMMIYAALLYVVTLAYYKRRPPRLSQELTKLSKETAR